MTTPPGKYAWTVKIGERGQFVIPKEARDMLGVKPGDTILGMDLSHGGHLTHGSKASISGKYFNACFYGVDRDSEMIDYEAALKAAKEVQPKLIIAGASAYPRFIDFAKMRAIADEVGAYLMVTWPTSPVLWLPGSTPAPCPMRTLSPPPPTRPSAAPAVR